MGRAPSVVDCYGQASALMTVRKGYPPPADQWHGTYLAYTERVRLANPFLQDPAELGEQIDALIRADGRSADEERQILRAGRAVVVR